MPSSSQSMQSNSSSSSGSSFWDAGSDSDPESDAQHEYSEWRDCLRGMEAKYPRGGVGTPVTHVHSGKYDAVEPVRRRQGVLRSSQDLAAQPEPETPRPASSMHSYPDEPPAYEVAVAERQGKTHRPSPPAAVQLAQTKNGAHLALFQTLAADVGKNPHGVIHRISQWLMDPQSPEFWMPFGLSIRGLAHEQLGRDKYAQKDYAEGLRRFYHLRYERGEASVDRLKENVELYQLIARKNNHAKQSDDNSCGQGDWYSRLILPFLSDFDVDRCI
ncbi:hypothetical protein FRC10_005873 [Ceratobasidium sp. 414]|nr:hypothetical protein FRC10_005873 [Ceratobasidium sp. 414]